MKNTLHNTKAMNNACLHLSPDFNAAVKSSGTARYMRFKL